MRRRIVAVTLGALALVAGAGAAWAQHTEPPTRVDLPLGLGHLSLSRETTKGSGAAGVDCPLPASAPANAECYTTYDGLKKGAGGDAKYVILSGFTGAGVPVLSGATAGPVTYAGLWSNEPGAPSGNGRVWTGVKIDGVGTVAVAAGGGAADSTGHPHGCVQAFASDGTSGNQIAHTLSTLGVTDNAADTETDVQLCGVIGG